MKPVDLTSAAIDDGTTSGDPSRRGIVRRECHCPEWVIRCAHLPDGILQWCAPDAPPEHGHILKIFPPGAEAEAVEYFITEEERRLRSDVAKQ